MSAVSSESHEPASRAGSARRTGARRRTGRFRRQRMAGRGAVPALPGGPRLGRPGVVELLRRLPAHPPQRDGPSAGPQPPGPPPRRPPRRRPRRPAPAPAQPPAAGSAGPAGRAGRPGPSPLAPSPAPPARLRPPAGRRGQQAARRGGPHRQQHDGQPGRAHRDQRPRGPGQAARGQQDRHQQPPAPRPRRQGVVHPPDRVRGGQGAGGAAGDEPRLRRGERQAGHRPAGPRQPGPGHRRAHRRRRQAAARAEPQGGGGDGLPPVLDDLRGRRAPGARGQARGRRLPGHHRDDHQPRHDRHRALGAAADGRPGLHRGRRGDGVPGRLRRGVRGDPGPAGHQQVGHAHLDLRPPDHPGRPVRRVPEEDPRAAARRGRLLRRDLRRAAHPVRAGPLGQGLPVRPRGRRRQVRPGAGADPRLPGARSPDGRHQPARGHPAQAPRPGHQPARADPVGPGARLPHRRVRREGADEAAGHPGRAARLVLPHRRHRVHAHPGPGGAPLAAGPDRGPAPARRARRADGHLVPAQRGRGVRDVPADQVRRPAPVLAGGRRVAHPAGRRGAHRGGRRRTWTRPSSAWPTAAG